MWEGNPSEDPARKIWLHCFSLQCRVLLTNCCKAQIKDCTPQRCTALEMLAIWNQVRPGEKTNNFRDSRSHLVKFMRLLLRVLYQCKCSPIFCNYCLGGAEIIACRERKLDVLWGLFFVQMLCITQSCLHRLTVANPTLSIAFQIRKLMFLRNSS